MFLQKKHASHVYKKTHSWFQIRFYTWVSIKVKKKKLKNLSAASLSSSTRNLFPPLCIHSKTPSTLTLTTYLSTLAPVCLSSHRERSHSGPAVKGSIESSPRPPPCHHEDPTTQHNSETNLTFSPTSRIYPPRKSQAVSGKKHRSGFLENNQTTQPPEVLPLPLLPPATHAGQPAWWSHSPLLWMEFPRLSFSVV